MTKLISGFAQYTKGLSNMALVGIITGIMLVGTVAHTLFAAGGL